MTTWRQIKEVYEEYQRGKGDGRKVAATLGGWANKMAEKLGKNWKFDWGKAPLMTFIGRYLEGKDPNETVSDHEAWELVSGIVGRIPEDYIFSKSKLSYKKAIKMVNIIKDEESLDAEEYSFFDLIRDFKLAQILTQENFQLVKSHSLKLGQAFLILNDQNILTY